MSPAGRKNGKPRERRSLGAGWIDVTAPLRTGMICWPGDPGVRVTQTDSIARGDACNVSAISFASHSGTHVDAPRHFLEDGRGVDEVAIDAGIGPARVIAIRDRRAIREEELRAQRIRPGERVLFRTVNSSRAWVERPFDPSFVHITEGAARYLACCQIRTVGVDYISVGGFQEEAHGEEVHRILLRAGILIIEGLDLRRIRPGPHQLVCLPLRLAHGDGAPARVVLKPAGRPRSA